MKPIIVQRSIRQGCPIAPSLLVIDVDSLFYIMRDASLGHPIKDITLPNEDELINAQFADDATLLLDLSEDSFSMAIHRVDFFMLYL